MLSTSKSKYEQIQTELSLQIRQGMLRPGDKLPSEQELAAAYGVSRLTVCRFRGRALSFRRNRSPGRN